MQNAELTGRLQQAEQANSGLLAHMATQQPLLDSADTASPASKQTVQSTSPAATELVDSGVEEEQQLSGHGTRRASLSMSRTSEQPSIASGRESSGSEADSTVGMDRQASSSLACITSMQTALADLVETLSQDAARLQKIVEAQSGSERQNASRLPNWGFLERGIEASPGPSRPVTAAPCDRSHRSNRQWSAGSARPESGTQRDFDQPCHFQHRPLTAGDESQHSHGADTPQYSVAAGTGAQAGGRRHKRRMNSSWRDPVPPSRMPEEILRQAREEYMLEKNRVREKRLKELVAQGNSGSATR